jgi:acyl-CoA synthetase (AMP-forming)/AMP-acid ligase II
MSQSKEQRYGADGGAGLKAEFSTWVELLRYRAAQQPDRRAYTFLSDGEEEQLTFAELDAEARTIAAHLQAGGAAGERVLLLYPPGLRYVASFYGCLYAGAIAVPVYPPHPNRAPLRLQSVAADSQAAVALTTGKVLSKLKPLLGEHRYLKDLRYLATEELDGGLAREWRDPQVSSGHTAFLQYTSGSTATPKGVIVSHANLMHNEELMRVAWGHSDETDIVSWLPIYHDMGLIGCVLQTMYLGTTCFLMSPSAFLQRPYRWLQAVSQHKAHTSGAPNFAYELCVNKISDEQKATLDLSHWRVAFNGAEPVRHETLERFAAAFAACGLRPETLRPGYGLAEATLVVSSGPKAAPSKAFTFDGAALEQNRVVEVAGENENARTLVGCGQTWLEQKIVIADPETLTRCAPDEVGEIWVSGPSVAGGYWKRAEETERTFRAHLSDTAEVPFLRTGDLGFFYQDELIITGRLKDLIIIGGRNHYPQDIELAVERSSPALRPGCGAAFSVERGGEERLVVVVEVDHRYRPKPGSDGVTEGGAAQDKPAQRRQEIDPAEVVKSVRRAVMEQHEVPLEAVLLLRAGSIPKTSSGKIQRHACKVKFLENSHELWPTA